MRLAYFVNLYPAVSHTFIRREIRAMEALGISVVRFALRSDPACVDPQDRAEAALTRLVLGAALKDLARSVASAVRRQPRTMIAILLQAVRMGWRSNRGLFRHVGYVIEAAVLADWCLRDGVAHIHAHFGTNSSAIAMFASRLSGIPYSFTAHGPEEFDKGAFLSLAEKLRFATFAACVSAFGRMQLMRLTPQELWHKIAIVHCGLDPAFLSATPSACPPSPRVVCVGRLCSEKAQFVLIAAARRLKEAGESFEIILAGDGPLRGDLEAAIADANLRNEISIIGWVPGDRVRQEILSARALVLPSFAENMPVVIMEAMALNRPVVSTYVAGIPELVEPGRTGWLVAAGDETALAQALRAVLHAPTEQLTAMGAAGRAHVLDQHDALKEAGKLKALIEGAASHSSRKVTHAAPHQPAMPRPREANRGILDQLHPRQSRQRAEHAD